MEQRACPQCAAENPSTAGYCWQCYGHFDSSEGPSAAAGTVTEGPLARAGVLAPPAPPPLHPAPTTGGTAVSWVVRGVVLVVAAVGGWLAVDWFLNRSPFPEEIAGQPRIESEEARDVQEFLQSAAEMLDLEMESAFYGRGMPSFMMLTITLPEGTTADQLWAQLDAASADVMQPYPIPDGSDFGCAPGAQGFGAMCVWVEDDLLVEVDGLSSSVEELETIARDLRAELG